MGEVYQYHITMLVTTEQVDAIRSLFKDKNWPCWLKVLSDENVAAMVQRGFTDIFPVMTAGQDGGIGQSVFTEIKSEVVDIEDDSDLLEKQNDLQRKIEQPKITDDEDTMDYDMMCTDDAENSGPGVDGGKQASARKGTGTKRRQSSPKTEGDSPEKEKPNKLKCPLCEVTCVTKTILKRHFKRRHKGSWLDVECSDCKKRFKTKEDLWEHRREANHEPPKESAKMFSVDQLSPEELQKLGHLKCEICANYYPHRRSLRRHLYKVHRDVLPKWNCPICDSEFDTRDELWKHKREKQHKTNIWTLGNYQCDSCGKIYTRYDSFTEHQLSCEKTESEKLASRQHPCDICGLVFKSVIRVKAHKRGVHIVAPVVCHVCGAICKNKRALLVHRRRHDMKNKKYNCDDCGKSFFNSTLLSQHVRTHTKEKPYKCPMCNYTCAIKQNIHKHSQKVHKTQCKAICLDDTKESSVLDSDKLVTSEQSSGSLNNSTEDLVKLQSKELQDKHARSSFQPEFMNVSNVQKPSEFTEVLDYRMNAPSFSQGSFQHQYQ
ncbi:zinc finger protein 391-like [Mercenaria mercenaria]|uniref:zinc finger protein 391-like n=1 Tax=Mercenaria mercenaria TaxID=6596 RepID=UPI001E1D82F5|nr:zinc finger protein 391-like [Mercenaria mercenaria]